MGYQRPTTAAISDSWAGHKNRNPPSAEPGTDYACAYGTDLAMADPGTVAIVDHSPSGGEGRRLSINLDDGRRVDYIHLASIQTSVGHRVGRGQYGVCRSGASGNGSDWYYGPHVHVSLWERPGMAYSDTIDFEAHAGDDEGDDELNTQQADQLLNIYNAIFHGGPSMPDGSRSLGQSVSDIANGLRPVVHRANDAGEMYQTHWIQELADIRTAQLNATGKSSSELAAPAWVVAGAVVLFVIVNVATTIAGLAGAG